MHMALRYGALVHESAIHQINSKGEKMDELVNMISKKTGLTPEMSKTVINMVLDFVKKKAPALAPEIDMLVSNSGAAAGVANALGGLLGKKK
jgi:oligoribonuclease (3'-5' exoribonuclease)